METHKIDDIRREFSNEWLLIAVDEIDSTTHEPLKGHLLAHGPNRESIHDASKAFEGVAYVVHSDDWPDDLAACFIMNPPRNCGFSAVHHTAAVVCLGPPDRVCLP